MSSLGPRGESASFRVQLPGRVAPTVTLYPADSEWSCDCDGKVDPCAHVAAAAIASVQPESGKGAQGEGDAVASPEGSAPTPRGRLRYHLTRKLGALSLERIVVQPDGSAEPLAVSLTSSIARGAQSQLLATHEDLLIDRMVAGRRNGYFPDDRLIDIFAALEEADVYFDGQPIKTSGERIGPRAEIVDEGGRTGGVALVIDKDPRITELVLGGVARVGDTLHPLGELDITGARLEKLPLRRVFPKTELGTLVADVLPEIERRMQVDIRTKKLPTIQSREKPRIAFELGQAATRSRCCRRSSTETLPRPASTTGGSFTCAAECRCAKRRRSAPSSPDFGTSSTWYRGGRVDFDGADAGRFASRLLAWKDDSASAELRAAGTLVPRTHFDENGFKLDFTLETDDARASKNPATVSGAMVVRAWEDGLPLVPLDGGGFAMLPAGWLEKHGARVVDLLAARRDDGTLAPAMRPALAELCDALEHPRPPGLDRLAPLFEQFESIPDAPLPSDLTATLRSYQRHGVSWLCFLRDAGLGAVLADDMGLGKTLQTLCALKGRALVVCPRSVIHNWGDEISRFRPGLTYSFYHGPKRALDPTAHVTLTTYAVLRLDSEILAEEKWDAVVLDESQAIKNPDSQVARAAYSLNASFRVALSGTPVENRLAELWSQMHFTNRGLLGGRKLFEQRYEDPIARGEPGAAAKLRSKIRPFVLRRLKKDVAPELPPRSDAVLYVELDDAERSVYDAVRAATRKDVVARLAEGGSVLAALEALLRLRQAACHSSLVPGQHAETSSKLVRLVEALEDAVADGHKALVFSQWTSLLDLCEPHLTASGIAFTRLDGKTRDRAGVVASFQDEGGPPVLLVSLKAGGTGLNLTAADHVFLLDPWWNPAVEDQAKDRAHRIGQERPVIVYRLVAKDTVEEGILALQERKRGLSDAALGGADQAGGLTRDDLLALLR